MRLALFQPDIPQNLGASIRLTACLGVPLDVIEPCGFPLSDRTLKRAALDYGDKAQVSRHDSWSEFLANRVPGRLILFTTRGAVRLSTFRFETFRFEAADTLLMGRESAGVPDEVHAAAHARVVIPIRAETRSLNLATAAAIGLFEALRQTVALPGAD